MWRKSNACATGRLRWMLSRASSGIWTAREVAELKGRSAGQERPGSRTRSFDSRPPDRHHKRDAGKTGRAPAPDDSNARRKKRALEIE